MLDAQIDFDLAWDLYARADERLGFYFYEG